MSSPRKSRQKATVDDAVKLVSKCDTTTKVRGNIQLQLALDSIQEEAENHGLKPDHIPVLLNKAASGELERDQLYVDMVHGGYGSFAQTVSVRLIRCLIPRIYVPEDAVVKAVSWMCTNKPSTTVQCFLVRWILLVFDHMDSRAKLHNLYGILFYFLENQTLFPYVCHLLYQLTRKEDVRMFRVRRLLYLQTKYGAQPYIVGLLSLYKLYYPHLVSVPASSAKKIFFKTHDRKWAEIIHRVKEQALLEQGLSVSMKESEISKTAKKRFSTSSSFSRSKKRKVIVPMVRSSGTEDIAYNEHVSLMIDHVTVPFVRINSFKEMLTQIDRIEFPTQVSAALQDPLLQHVVAYSADQIVAMRFSYWLQHTFIEEFFEMPRENKEEKEKFLQLLIKFTDFLQEGIPVVDMFLQRYLTTWNGSDYRQHILRLISRSRIYQFSTLNDLVLEPLRKLFFSSSVYFKCQIVLTLTELIRNYAAFEWPRYKEQMRDRNDEEADKPCMLSIFEEQSQTFPALRTLQELIAFVDNLSLIGLQMENNNVLLANCVLDYIELLSTLIHEYNIPFVFLPSSTLLGSFLFGNTVLTVARLCSVTCGFRGAFEAIKATASVTEEEKLESDGREEIQRFNRFLLDLCNGLYRNRAFETSESILFDFNPGDLGVTVPRLSESFSLYQHQAFLGLSVTFLRETQPPEKKVHVVQIKTVKDYFLNFLEKEHVTAVPKFIKTFIRKTQRKASVPT